MVSPGRTNDTGSRARVFAAAAAEFAARGYAGANMDRIARTARLNKAMIYYHFPSKAALYRAILRDMFDAVRARVHAVATSAAPPDEKIRRYVRAIAAEADARPHFPPIWLREIAEGGERVDAHTMGYIRDVLAALGAIMAEGRRAGRFQAAGPRHGLCGSDRGARRGRRRRAPSRRQGRRGGPGGRRRCDRADRFRRRDARAAASDRGARTGRRAALAPPRRIAQRGHPTGRC